MEKTLLDILWILISAFLVFLMQPGFMCLESGLTRSKNSISVAVKNLSDFILSVFVFWAVGYGLMYGISAAGLIGKSGFFLRFSSGEPFPAAFFLFQAMFCGTATTIFSGAVAERMGFAAYLLLAFLLSAFIYPIFGHWAWNGLNAGETGGWLGRIGFVDFAGSTVVHSVGGWMALATILVIGPRQGRFSVDGTPKEIHGSNIPLSLLGALLLWVGWFGFNGGSTLAMNGDVPGIIVRTVLAGAGGGLASLFWGWYLSRIPKATYLINGSLGGLVAITAGCHAVGTFSAVFIGVAAGFVCIGTDHLLIRRKIDDAVGAVPVHLGCGIWGTLAAALFGDPLLLATELSLGGQLMAQMAGIISAFFIAFLIPFFILGFIDPIFPLRVSPDDEKKGLNVSEHGAKTEFSDLFDTIEQQAMTRDLSLRVPEEPFTEAGMIARRYNQLMDALQRAVVRTEAVVTTAKDAFLAVSTDNFKILRANPGATLIFGYEADAFAGMPFSALFLNPEIPERCIQTLCKEEAYSEMTGRRSNGETFPMEAAMTIAAAGKESFYVATFRDLTARKKAEDALFKERAYFEKLFESSPQAIVILDPDGRIQNANRGFGLLFGHDPEAIIGQRNRDLVVPEDRIEEVKSFNNVILNGHSIRKETYRKHRNGHLIPVSLLGFPIKVNGRIEGIFYIYNDISERKSFEAQLYEKAFYDFLTGIANRVLFLERLQRALERSQRRPDYRFSVLLIDLDRFKWVNDSLGHLAGDNLLIEISKRFTGSVRAMDTVARLGGDEFAVLIEEYSSPAEVINIAKRIQIEAQKPFHIESHEVHISSSIGIVIKTSGYQQPENILRDADIAMYRAKEMGKARFKVFNQKMHELVFEKLKMENELREAIAKDQLTLFYQPIMSVERKKLEGFEALVRWNHPVQGIISPVKFIPIAEETGLILPLGRWVMEAACNQLKRWHEEIPGGQDLSISVNISGKQFLQRDLIDFIIQTLHNTGLDAHHLRVELTETVLMEHANTAVEQLRRLKSIGVKIAIDDFGTGYSSLSYLQRFPIDCLKIDRSFIDRLGIVEEKTEIVKTILALARNLKIGVIAEGVETNGQLSALYDLRCDNAQGYLFSKPVDEKMSRTLLEKFL